jgi:ABC-type multidrug transport system ATPase subunit
MMTHEIIVQTTHLKKHFGKLAAVEDVSLTVNRGEVYGFLGPNGAGKTTTIGMLLGLIHPTGGSIELFGQPVAPAHPDALKQVGALVGASPALLPYLTARQNLEVTGLLYPDIARKRRVDELLDLVGLTEAANRKAGQFSTGMKQRLALANALYNAPGLLILDEPTNGMDPAGMREVRNLLRTLVDQGVTVLISSHLLHEVEQVCDRVAVLSRGRVVAEGAVAELMGDQQAVRVRVASPADAVQSLQSLPSVKSIEPNGSYITVKGVQSEAIVAHLVGQGIVPGEVSVVNGDLESLFLELTQEPIQGE